MDSQTGGPGCVWGGGGQNVVPGGSQQTCKIILELQITCETQSWGLSKLNIFGA